MKISKRRLRTLIQEMAEEAPLEPSAENPAVRDILNQMEKIEFDSSSMMEPYFIANVDPETNILSTKTEWKDRRLREPKWTNPIGIHQVLERRQKFRLIVFKLLASV